MTFDLWTLGFQAVNVLVLIWLLHRFFWKPVAATINARQAAAATLLDEAEAGRTRAETALAEIAATREGLTAERDAMLTKARKDAETARDALLATARADVETLHDIAKTARVRAAEALKASAADDAQGLAITIAGRLVARLDGSATDAAFLGWLVEGLLALSDAQRAALSDVQLEIVSAADQDSVAREGITRAVTNALGAPATLAFRTDPALIAGHELHAPHFTLRNSWRADLARIAAEIGHKGDLTDAA